MSVGDHAWCYEVASSARFLQSEFGTAFESLFCSVRLNRVY